LAAGGPKLTSHREPIQAGESSPGTEKANGEIDRGNDSRPMPMFPCQYSGFATLHEATRISLNSQTKVGLTAGPLGAAREAESAYK
jgi:hypothetical protein